MLKNFFLGRTDFRAVNFKMVKLKKHFVIEAETPVFSTHSLKSELFCFQP